MKNVLLKTIGITILIITQTSLVLADEWSEFNLEKMRATVKEKNIKRIDDLFSIFPNEMKKNPLLIYHSQALKTGMVSFETPRIILFNKDASLIIAISKNPGELNISKGKDSVEIMAFNKKDGKFELYDEVFDGVRSPFAGKISKNPKQCLSCHGTNPRPFFNDYNGWPGFYGSFGTQGVAAVDSSEYEGLRKFLDTDSKSERYKHLDLSGFYDYQKLPPGADPATTEKKFVGIAYNMQGLTKGFLAVPELAGVHEKVKFTPNLAFGMELESLMHQRLAAKLNRRKDFENIFPLFYYLGEEKVAFEVVEGRCGHPNDRIKRIYDVVEEMHPGQDIVLNEIIQKIENQVKIDFDARKAAVEKNNILSPLIDPRGIAAIPYAFYFANAINKITDPERPKNFKKQNALIEILLGSLGLTSADITTGRNAPTSGIYHLSRLGRMAVDEQYFQNLMRGFKAVRPDLVSKYDQIDCANAEQQAVKIVEKLVASPVVAKKVGVLYK